MSRAGALETLTTLAESQWGLFTRAQARRFGVDSVTITRLATAGIVDRVAHGVYRFRGAPPADSVDLRAAWLQLAPAQLAEERLTEADAVVSHRSAARVLGLGDLPADTHEFTVARRRQSRRDDVRFHVRPLRDLPVNVVSGLPVTVAERVVADLLGEQVDGGHVGTVLVDALRAGLADVGAVAEAVAPHAVRYGFGGKGAGAFLEHLLRAGGATVRRVPAGSETARRLSASTLTVREARGDDEAVLEVGLTRLVEPSTADTRG